MPLDIGALAARARDTAEALDAIRRLELAAREARQAEADFQTGVDVILERIRREDAEHAARAEKGQRP